MSQEQPKRALFTPEQMTELLESLYTQVTHGLPTSKPCQQLASEYLQRYQTPDKAIKVFIRQQTLKCSTSGFLTSLGGILTLPVAIPANLASVLYIQLRMIATIASMGGYDVNDDEVETLVFMCLAGTSISDACKQAGITIANKTTMSFVKKKIPGELIKKINSFFGFRLVTIAGSKGVINLTKLVPIAGGIVGGSFDWVTTQTIASRAYKTFIVGELS